MPYRIVLVGNPNSGKTTVFNRLAGAREKIGNWPGTTVERKEGCVRLGDIEAVLVDLPGTYSLEAFSPDEVITRDFIVREKPDLVIAVLDAMNFERGLYLALECLEMGHPLILDLNMEDLAAKTGIETDRAKLADILKVPVVSTVALTGEGISRLTEAIQYRLGTSPPSFRIDYGEFESAINGIENLLTPFQNCPGGLPPRAAAIRILENDQSYLKTLRGTDVFEAVYSEKEKANALYREGAENILAEKRHAFAKGLAKECTVHRLTMEERLTLTDRIDKVVTSRIFGVPIFLGFMYALFSVVFSVGNPIVEGLNRFFFAAGEMVRGRLAMLGAPPWVGSLAGDGVLGGVGSVLSFLPYIMLLFFGICLLEDTGYLARAAFVMDRFMHRLDLHGKSFIPMLLGFGCNIPGIMAARTLPAPKDRILTILILPLMSCSARLPVYVLFAGALFPETAGAVVFSLYLFGIVLAMLMAKLFKRVMFPEPTAPLVIELPPYRVPYFKNVAAQMTSKATLFVRKAGTVILAASVISWGLASFPFGVEYASQESMIGKIGVRLAPLFAPAGFGFWQAAVALIMGIVAKEIIIGTFGTLYGVQEGGLAAVLQDQFTPVSGYAFLLMTLIYIPCIATVGAIRAELNWRWAAFAVFYTLVLGWGVSVLFYQIGSRFF